MADRLSSLWAVMTQKSRGLVTGIFILWFLSVSVASSTLPNQQEGATKWTGVDIISSSPYSHLTVLSEDDTAERCSTTWTTIKHALESGQTKHSDLKFSGRGVFKSRNLAASVLMNQKVIHPYLLTDSPTPVIRPDVIPLSSSNMPATVYSLLSSSVSPNLHMFHTRNQKWSEDSDMLQTSEDFLLDTETFQPSLPSFLPDSEILQTRREDLFSNAESSQTGKTDFVSDVLMPQTFKDRDVSTTNIIHSSAQSLILNEGVTQKPPHVDHGSITASDDHESVVFTTSEQKDVTMTATTYCCSDLTILPSHTLSSMLSHSAVVSGTNSESSNDNDVQQMPRGRNLTIVQLQNNTGFITTPGFKDYDRYPNNTQDTYCFSLSDDQSLLLSFPYFHLEDSYDNNCRYDYLRLTTENGPNNTKPLWKKCGIQTIHAQVITASVVCLNFVSDFIIAKKGFNVTYSILPKSEKYYKTDSGYFNCSAFDLYPISLHFGCNLILECHDKQDEKHCSYSSEECPDLLQVGGKCLTMNVRTNVTWFDASSECKKQNQVLFTPQSLEEWNSFVNVTGSVRRSIFVYLGLHPDGYSSVMPYLYRETWRWSTGTTAFYNYAKRVVSWDFKPTCVLYNPYISNITVFADSCTKGYDILIMCQNNPTHQNQSKPGISPICNQCEIPNTTVVCSQQHLVRNYLECDLKSRCHDGLTQEQCVQQSATPTPDLFSCHFASTYSVHYTLLCDHNMDCPDGSDETFCVHNRCPEDTCKNGQCIHYWQRCDGTLQCLDGSDEICVNYRRKLPLSIPLPVIVEYDRKGSFNVQSLNISDDCPDTHFRCQNQDCLPIFLRCNEVFDCPGHEDEDSADCDTVTCPGFLRCRDSNVCVHTKHICDGIAQCPLHDDEVLCNQTCPQGCNCQGHAFVCNSSFTFSSFPALRYIHIDHFRLSALDLTQNTYLVLLRLSKCRLKSMSILKLDGLHNLQTLNLKDNLLTSIELSMVNKMGNLRSLVLSGNPLSEIKASSEVLNYMDIDLSYTYLETIDNETFLYFPRMQTLNISYGHLTRITAKSFNSNRELKYLDLRGTSLQSYPKKMLCHLSKLKYVWANDFRLCCKPALPKGFNLEQCDAPRDVVASCDDLLQSTTYKIFLWIIAAFALIGNAGSFAARLHHASKSRKTSFNLFVLNLSVSDFLMGVYLTMVGVADQIFRGQYWWRADVWKNSAACKTAGFLALTSNEVSAFFIFLITIDRFLVLRFPFSNFHFGHRSALKACLLFWTVGLILAGIPLLPWTSHWDFYGQTGICIPLPFIRAETFSGYFYSFSVMIILNFVLFILIAVGQILIYWSVRREHQSQITKNTHSKDAAIARRLIAIVFTDFMCWFPTGVLGVLAFKGHDIQSHINVIVAIFVMPFNSALNPFLYTLSLVMEKRRKAIEARVTIRLRASMQSEATPTDATERPQSQRIVSHQNDNFLENSLTSHIQLTPLQ